MYLAQMLTAAAKYGFPIIVSCSQFLHFLKVPTLYHSLNFLKRAYFTGFPATLIFSSHSPLSKIKIFSFFESGHTAISLVHF